MTGKRYPGLPSAHSCTGCKACGDICPHQCISFPSGGDGHWYVNVDTSKCIRCLRCESVCPVINRRKPLSKASAPYAAWTVDTKLRSKSSSGGTFAQIALAFLHDGGYVAGAMIEETRVRHIVIQSDTELNLLQGSKYVQSDTSGIYSEVLTLLKNGKKVLFSGLGCQVAALYNVIPHRLWSNLFTIDLICHGVPSSMDLDRYLKMHDVKITKIISFRDKSWKNGYAMTCKDEKGNIIRDEDNYFFSAFNNNKSLRWACYTCKFKTLHRCSDITIGDFWGAERYKSELPKGLSLCIVHSSKGQSLIANNCLVTNHVDWKECLTNNKDYFLGNNLFRYHPIRWLYPLLMKYGSDDFVKLTVGSMYSKSWFRNLIILWMDKFFQHLNYKYSNKSLLKFIWALKK